ncbi:MAG: hydrogenase maturation nickel metallochaperone HypA [Chloroflexi bacterium]|nr:hydrogenase maturation nickel metallochaperone HypA [Chloroflexota bacterium]
MHELSVTENILKIALRHANENNAKIINDIYLVIGDLSSIVDDAVEFYWNIVAENTIAKDARLHFKRIQAILQCQECLAEYQLSQKELSCPKCGSDQVRIVSGDEFYLEAIEIDR